MSKKVVIIVAAVIVLAAGAAAAFPYMGGQQVTVDTAGEREVIRTVSGTGYFAASEERKIVARHAMIVQQVLIEEGQIVEAGETLIRGDTDDLQVEKRSLLAEAGMLQTEITAGEASISAQKLSAESTLEAARGDLQQALSDAESLRRLYEQGAAAEKDYQRAQLAVNAAEARVQEAQAALQDVRRRESQLSAQRQQLEVLSDRTDALQTKINHHEMTAGQSMIIADVHVDEGDVVAAGTPLGMLHSNEVKLEIDLLAQDAREVTEGQKALISGEALGDREYRGAISRLHPHAVQMVSDLGVRQRRVPVEITPDEHPQGVRPGYPADIEIVVAGETGLAVDRDALFSLDDEDHVFRVVDGQARLAAVKVGLRGDDLVIITDGLSDGDEVVVNPPEELDDGDRVRKQ